MGEIGLLMTISRSLGLPIYLLTCLPACPTLHQPATQSANQLYARERLLAIEKQGKSLKVNQSNPTVVGYLSEESAWNSHERLVSHENFGRTSSTVVLF